jgi:hypothetical protein
LPNKIRASYDLENLVVVLSDEGELEAIFCRVNGDCPGFGSPVKTVNDLTFDSSEVNWLVKSLDDSVITGEASTRRPDYLESEAYP